jgi:S-adenosylhomocysteine hydrolase
LVGYGKFGKHIAGLLHAKGMTIGIMETSPHAYVEACKDGYVAYYADATNEESIRECF